MAKALDPKALTLAPKAQATPDISFTDGPLGSKGLGLIRASVQHVVEL